MLAAMRHRDSRAPAPTIRLATSECAKAVHRIYAPIVRDTAISFEWEIPTVSDLAGRIEAVLSAGYPWLVAEVEGDVAGYAYAAPFRARKAYAWTAEVSVYVGAQHARRGIGRALYARLFELLALQGFRGVYGVATTPNASSEALHRSMGFREVGRLPRVGYKLGAWHDVIYWHLELNGPDEAPGEIRAVQDVLDAQRPAATAVRARTRRDRTERP